MVVSDRKQCSLRGGKKGRAGRNPCTCGNHLPSARQLFPTRQLCASRQHSDDVVHSTSSSPLSPLSPDDPETLRRRAREKDADVKCEEISVGSVLIRPFKDLCRFLHQLDLENDGDLVAEMILHFSLRIYGLPECRSEDLPLAVYLFIEDAFGIQSKIELCVQLYEQGHSNVIGVVFQTISMKYSILKNDALLEDTEVRMKHNQDLKWIVEELCWS